MVGGPVASAAITRQEASVQHALPLLLLVPGESLQDLNVALASSARRGRDWSAALVDAFRRPPATVLEAEDGGEVLDDWNTLTVVGDGPQLAQRLVE